MHLRKKQEMFELRCICQPGKNVSYELICQKRGGAHTTSGNLIFSPISGMLIIWYQIHSNELWINLPEQNKGHKNLIFSPFYQSLPGFLISQPHFRAGGRASVPGSPAPRRPPPTPQHIPTGQHNNTGQYNTGPQHNNGHYNSGSQHNIPRNTSTGSTTTTTNNNNNNNGSNNSTNSGVNCTPHGTPRQRKRFSSFDLLVSEFLSWEIF